MARRDQYTNQVAVGQVQDPGPAVSCVCVVAISVLLVICQRIDYLQHDVSMDQTSCIAVAPGIRMLLFKPVQYVSRGPFHCDVIRTLPVGGEYAMLFGQNADPDKPINLFGTQYWGSAICIKAQSRSRPTY